MNRRVRAPFVTTLASVVIAISGGGCGPNPPMAADDCPMDTPNHADSCSARSTCYYDTAGCEGSSSTWTKASCVGGEWSVQQEGSSCNPPFPMDSGAAETSSDADAPAGCPTNEPAINSACDAIATCSYANLCPQTSGIKTNIYHCTAGKWRFEDSLESPIDCPKAEPKNGEACGCAMYLPAKCTYGSNDAVSDGATQKWIVKAPSDAGADAATSSDAGIDAPASTDASAADSD
jgi:hypothetical protein